MKAKKIKFSQSLRLSLNAALVEDLGRGDITTRILIPENKRGKACIKAREKGVFSGAPLIEILSAFADPGLKTRFLVKEGEVFRKGQTVVLLQGRIASILKIERVALNLLSHLSGISTKTRKFVHAIRKSPVLILDTRKTTPLWREAEKYAVRMGGGRNHRTGLYDEILVKENHRIHGNLKKLAKWRGRFEIEVRNMAELKEAIALEPRIIMFDNFSIARLKRGVEYVRSRKPSIILETSGGMNLKNVSGYAKCGVDWISVGSLTHSVAAIDFSLLV